MIAHGLDAPHRGPYKRQSGLVARCSRDAHDSRAGKHSSHGRCHIRALTPRTVGRTRGSRVSLPDVPATPMTLLPVKAEVMGVVISGLLAAAAKLGRHN